MNTTPIYTLGALLRDRAARRPDEPALVFPDSPASQQAKLIDVAAVTQSAWDTD
jgi:acyl-CoA synthetase (AMP-forming)/AMP-acid ligase II